jgi:hypothetical protein
MNMAIAKDRIASEHYRFDEKRHIHAVEQRVSRFAELIGVAHGVRTPRVQDDQVGVVVDGKRAFPLSKADALSRAGRPGCIGAPPIKHFQQRRQLRS